MRMKIQGTFFSYFPFDRDFYSFDKWLLRSFQKFSVLATRKKERDGVCLVKLQKFLAQLIGRAIVSLSDKFIYCRLNQLMNKSNLQIYR